MLNADILESLFRRVAEEKFMKEVHEWIIYTAPPDILKVYREYLEEVNSPEIKIDE